MIQLSSFIVVILGTIVGSIGTLLIKKGTQRFSFSRLWKSPEMWGGAALYIVSTLFYVIALRQEELSVVYPIVSFTYIWTTLLSVKFLGEKMNKFKWIALVGIILGVTMVGLGS
ncbi:TPA: EamA family transporter [Candidatus Woesearchaeota archaeon]|nr:EamA family transporter [Candidatus Woesearchaeota archaeon]